MSFTLNKVKDAKRLCVIQGGKYDGRIISLLSNEVEYDDENDEYRNFSRLKLTEAGAKIFPIPSNSERTVISLLGCSGCGKSYIAQKFISFYQKLYPSNQCFSVSLVEDDPSLKGLNLTPLKLDNETWLSDGGLTIKDIPQDGSLFLFDDVDTIRNKDIKSSIMGLKDDILQCGRHTKTTCVLTSHLSTKGNETKLMLSESHIIIIYMSSGSSYKYLLERYLSLDTKQIKKLQNMNTRYIGFFKSYPMCIFTEKEIFLLKDL